MSESDRHSDAELQPEAPDALRGDLAALFAPPPVPREIDDAILAYARRELTRPKARRVARWLAAAAAAALIAVVMLTRGGTAQDIDRNGRVDILDALVLARRIDASAPLERSWDFNGDGTVDRLDVDRVAHAAVRLERGTF